MIAIAEKMNPLTISTVDEETFLAIRALYDCWDEWKETKACFLSKKEILVMEFYETYFKYRSAALELDLFVEPVPEIYNPTAARALRKLEHYYEYYERWLER
jgi:hypothetical protein